MQKLWLSISRAYSVMAGAIDPKSTDLTFGLSGYKG
jgi:hypothetical protein